MRVLIFVPFALALAQPPQIRVDRGADRHTISKLVYGLNDNKVKAASTWPLSFCAISLCTATGSNRPRRLRLFAALEVKLAAADLEGLQAAEEGHA